MGRSTIRVPLMWEMTENISFIFHIFAFMNTDSSISLRASVHVLRDLSYSQHQVALKIGKPISFVKRWWSRPGLLNNPRSHCPTKITRSLEHKIIHRMRMKSRRSIRVMARTVGVNRESIRILTPKSGVYTFHPPKGRLLTQNNIKKPVFCGQRL